MVEVDPELIQTDVLVIGGGIAGLTASIGAAQSGASVVVAERVNSRRSGCGATGNDHFLCYCRPGHGLTDDIGKFLGTRFVVVNSES